MKEWSCYCLHHLPNSPLPPFVFLGPHWEGIINHIKHSRHIVLICLALLFLWWGASLSPILCVFTGAVSHEAWASLSRPWVGTNPATLATVTGSGVEYNPSSSRVFSLVDIEIERERDVFWLGLFSWKSESRPAGCHFILCMKGHEFRVKQGRDKKSGNMERERETEYHCINPRTQQCLFPSSSHFH